MQNPEAIKATQNEVERALKSLLAEASANIVISSPNRLQGTLTRADIVSQAALHMSPALTT
jgi:16S rRNA C1402 (ribose-2'-O) methylase RsmI